MATAPAFDPVVDFDLEPFLKVNETAREAVKKGLVGKDEIRFLVDAFYQLQGDRIRTTNQLRSLKDRNLESAIINWFANYQDQSERNLAKILSIYVDSQELGQWLSSILGIGPLISAGLMAYIDIEKAPTVGHIWRYAGLDPSSKWISSADSTKIVSKHVAGTTPTREEMANISVEINRRLENLERSAEEYKNGKPTGKITKASLAKGISKRPYNATLKTLCFKISDQLCVRQVNNEKNYYAPLFLERKAKEHAKNLAGDFADIAERKIDTVGKTTKEYKAYKEGKLSDGEIQMRSRRWLVKLFLSHYHHVAYTLRFGENPPKPYAFSHLGHGHVVSPPNWDEEEGILIP